MLERPPRDDLRLQRWLSRAIKRGVFVVAGGVVTLWLRALLTGERTPRTALGWIVAGVALVLVESLFSETVGKSAQKAGDSEPPFKPLGLRRKRR